MEQIKQIRVLPALSFHTFAENLHSSLEATPLCSACSNASAPWAPPPAIDLMQYACSLQSFRNV